MKYLEKLWCHERQNGRATNEIYTVPANPLIRDTANYTGPTLCLFVAKNREGKKVGLLFDNIMSADGTAPMWRFVASRLRDEGKGGRHIIYVHEAKSQLLPIVFTGYYGAEAEDMGDLRLVDGSPRWHLDSGNFPVYDLTKNNLASGTMFCQNISKAKLFRKENDLIVAANIQAADNENNITGHCSIPSTAMVFTPFCHVQIVLRSTEAGMTIDKTVNFPLLLCSGLYRGSSFYLFDR